MYTINCILFFTYANASPFTTITGSNSALHGGTKGSDKRKTDSATGRSNATGPQVESWKAHAVYLPGQGVWAECSTDGCTEGMWLEHFDPKDISTPVALVHYLPGRRGVEQRCRAEGGSQGVFRPQPKGSKSILSDALLRRAQRAKKKKE